jgi:CheY-like chemotaxis protein
VGQLVVRRDHSHAKGRSRRTGGPSSGLLHRDDAGIVERLAQLVGNGTRVRILGKSAEALARVLEARGCRTVITGAKEEGSGDGRFDTIVVTDLLEPIDDPRSLLRALREQIQPEGALIVALTGIAPIGDRLAILDAGPLGAGSGVLFTEEGLYSLLEEAEYVIGHVSMIEPASERSDDEDDSAPADDGSSPSVRDCLIVAHPMPVPGLDFLRRRMRELARRGEAAAREAGLLREGAAIADQRIEILSGQERRMADRIKDLRARLLDAHAEMIRRDDELRRTFGDASALRNMLLVERDSLIVQRQALLAERDALAAERDALALSVRAAELRLNIFRASPLGLAYRAIRGLIRRRGGRGVLHR